MQGLFLGALLLGTNFPALADDHPFETEATRVPAVVVGDVCLIKGATVHSAVEAATVRDVLVKQGKIAAVGVDLEAPDGATVIDGSGMHLAPGVVDCHSHMAMERGVNEGSLSITAEVRVQDVINVDDVSLYRALAGGVTTIRCLHGSANAIDGQDAVLKLRWGGERTAEDLLVAGADTGIKFALGENPRRVNWGSGGRYPATRMGVESVYYRGFARAKEYAKAWSDYDAAVTRGEDPAPPRRDLRLETLSGILDGDVKVHSHSYRADEILMLVRASQSFGFTIATMQHVLEGYKVAKELADAGVGGSTFSDWWAYKIEAYDAIPQNAALMDRAGVLTSINSDSAEMVRRMYEEAAKSVRYAGMDRVRALRLVTLNPAMQLGLGERIGSIEVGKDADLVLLNGDPLSSLSRVAWTMVDGEIEFSRVDAFGLDANPPLVAEIDEAHGDVPAAAEGTSVIALVGGTVHTVTGPVYENGTVLMIGDRIAEVGMEIVVPAGAQTIDVSGQHVWPGLIALSTTLGMYEIGAVAATVDGSEVGGSQPDLRVSASINAESAHLGIARWNGITRAQVTPTGRGPISGQSSVIDLDGDTWEELLFVDRDMLHVSFPRYSNVEGQSSRRRPGNIHDDICCHTEDEHLYDIFTSGAPLALLAEEDESREESESSKAMAVMFEEALEYGRRLDLAQQGAASAPPFDPRLEALVPFARGEKRVALHASNAQTILMAAKFSRDLNLDGVIYGAQEAWKVAPTLARLQIPVVVSRVWSTPRSSYDPYDSVFANTAVLARAGVPFAIACSDTDNERNLPFQAATAAAFGLPAEEAVRGITYYAARILGLEDQLGSLVPGKLADVIVTSGHVLEIDSPASHVFVGGVRVEHDDNRHTRFYKKYSARLERLQQD